MWFIISFSMLSFSFCIFFFLFFIWFFFCVFKEMKRTIFNIFWHTMQIGFGFCENILNNVTKINNSMQRRISNVQFPKLHSRAWYIIRGSDSKSQKEQPLTLNLFKCHLSRRLFRVGLAKETALYPNRMRQKKKK